MSAPAGPDEREGREPSRPMPGPLMDLAARVARLTAPLFADADWRWGNPRGGAEVPDAAAIAAMVQHLVEECPENGSVACGRFEVARSVDEGRNVEMYDVALRVGGDEGCEAA